MNRSLWMRRNTAYGTTTHGWRSLGYVIWHMAYRSRAAHPYTNAWRQVGEVKNAVLVLQNCVTFLEQYDYLHPITFLGLRYVCQCMVPGPRTHSPGTAGQGSACCSSDGRHSGAFSFVCWAAQRGCGGCSLAGARGIEVAWATRVGVAAVRGAGWLRHVEPKHAPVSHGTVQPHIHTQAQTHTHEAMVMGVRPRTRITAAHSHLPYLLQRIHGVLELSGKLPLLWVMLPMLTMLRCGRCRIRCDTARAVYSSIHRRSGTQQS